MKLIELNQNKFPDDFLFGIATTALHSEGAAKEDGKGETIWDRFIRDNPNRIIDHTNGDISCDFYHKYREDIKRAADMGINFFKFTVSWARILPSGRGEINDHGILHYNNVINEIIKNGMIPMVNLFHWDLPQGLQDINGWLNPNIVQYFVDYARIVFESFGDRVKYWITIDEPWNLCVFGHSTGDIAPGLRYTDGEELVCGYHMIKAHAQAYRLYEKEFKETQNGKISICLDTGWFEPTKQKKREHIEAAEMMRQFVIGWFAHPIYLGDYPPIMKSMIAQKSRAERYERSLLPEFTQEEIEYIKGTSDFFAFDYLSSQLVCPSVEFIKEDQPDAPVLGRYIQCFFPKEDWCTSASPYVKVSPWGLRKLLNWLKNNYGDIEIILTENGYSDKPGTLEDVDRIIYIQLHLSAILDAIEDGVNVKGYAIWTLVDGFELQLGYTIAFGLYFVDFTDPERERIAKKSVGEIKQIISDRKLPERLCEGEKRYITTEKLWRTFNEYAD